MLNTIQRAALLYYQSYPDGLSDKELAERLGISLRMATNHRCKLCAEKVDTARYTLVPDGEDIEFAHAVFEAVRRDLCG